MYINSFLYMNSLQCLKLFHYNYLKDKLEHHDSMLRHYTHEYIKPYDRVPLGEIEPSVLLTKQLIENGATSIVDAVFLYEDCYAFIDGLKVTEEGLVLYIAKGSTKVRKEYKQMAAYIYYVVSKAGYKIKSLYILTINNQYVRYGDVDPRLLFDFNDVTMDALDVFDKVEEQLSLCHKTIEHLEDVSLSPKCLQGCSHLDECFKDIKHPGIFDVGGFSKNQLIEFYNNGIQTYEDLLNSDIELTDIQRMQVESYVRDLPPIINERRMEYFLNQFKYPIYFLDFETYQVPVPLYEGCSPYQSMPFQYSLHVLYEDGKLEHYEFLANENEDPRESLAASLCEHIPADGYVVAYNNNLEKSVVMQLAILFQKYRDQLLGFYPHIYDLQYPFQRRDYYHKDMHGSYSIKNVLPALCPNDPALDYHYLDQVHNGSEAMYTYTHLDRLSEEEKEITKKNLLKYCELDTLAMVKIFEKIK